jgi:hypothetical protein
MTKVKKYKYLGRNGVLVTRIFIEDAKNIPMFTLNADKGKILTNGEITTYSITVEEDEIKLWREIPDKTN